MCSSCRARTEQLADAFARWHHGGVAGTGDRRAVLHAHARRPRRARDQGGAAGQRRLRACLRHALARAVVALRLDQPLEAEPDAGPQARRRARGAGAPAGPGRCAGAEPGARRSRAAGLVVRGAARAPSTPDRLRHLGLRHRRAVSRQEGLRPADPGRGGAAVGDRHARRAGEGGHLDRRHRGRRHRSHRHPRCAAVARAHRPWLACRGVDAREHGRVDGISSLLRARRRRGATKSWRGARDDLSLRAVPRRRWADRDARPAERARVAAVLRAGAAAAGAGG
jgi:hypothetical protein